MTFAQAVSTTTRVVGPIFVVFGLIMFSLGLFLCVVNWTMSRDERELSYMQKRIASAGPTGLLRSATSSASVWRDMRRRSSEVVPSDAKRVNPQD